MPTTTEAPIRIDPDPTEMGDFAADYGDAFRIPAPVEATPRDWAARSLRAADVAGGVFRNHIWGGALGLRIDPEDSPGTLVGWTITTDTADRLVLEALDGKLMDGRMTFVRADGALTWTTMLRYRSPRSRRVWATLGPIHRFLTPRLLTRSLAAFRRGAPT